MNPMDKRVQNIDIAKGIAIILVVWGHADVHMNPVFVKQYLHLLSKAIYSFHIPLFFMVSGALSALSLGKSEFTIYQYAKKKFAGLMIPFYTLNVIFFALNVVVPKSFTSAPDAKAMLLHIAIHQSHKDLPSGVLWFLFALFVFAVLNAFIIKKIKINKFVWLSISLFIMLVSPYFFDTYLFAIDRITRNLYFYVIGYVLSEFILKEKARHGFLYFICLSIVWCASFYCFYTYGYLWRIISGVSGSLFVIGISNGASYYKDNRVIKMLRYCGQNSVLIFVLHMPSLLVISKLVVPLKLSENLIGFAIYLIVGTALPLILGKIVSYHASTYRYMFGRYPMKVM